jgi:hypothetical protein
MAGWFLKEKIPKRLTGPRGRKKWGYVLLLLLTKTIVKYKTADGKPKKMCGVDFCC